MSPLVVAVVGPTASGKSALAMSLCRRFDGELVSADSVQVYRRFDIGSAKPTATERAAVPHHLVDVFDPLEPVDVARFVQLARAHIDDITARGKRPIVCGGTFLWVRGLVYGLADAPAADESIRARHRSEAEQHGRKLGATHVWLETSNVNVPGVRAYERLGYALCGADSLYYAAYMPGETAIYLAKRL